MDKMKYAKTTNFEYLYWNARFMIAIFSNLVTYVISFNGIVEDKIFVILCAIL